MSPNTVFALAATGCLSAQLALMASTARQEPQAVLYRAGARAALVAAAAVCSWNAGFGAHALALALLVLLWLISALSGHTLLEQLATYRDNIASQPMPADQEG